MDKTQHPKNNDVLGAPPGIPIEECEALPITRVKLDGAGLQGVISYWRPTAEELVALQAGALVAIMIQGRTHAPLYVGVDGVSIVV